MTTTAIKKIDINLPINSIDAYIHSVYQLPILSQAEEFALAERLQTQNDLEAAKQLVLSNTRYVVQIARNYSGYGLPLNDLIQEGNIGLMKAVKRFDPSVGVRLITFAVHWIKSEIHEYILRNWRIVKVATTKAQRKLFFNLRSAKKRLGWFTQEEVNTVAQDLGVKPETVREMEMRLHTSDVSFDKNEEDEDDATLIPAEYLEDTRDTPLEALEKFHDLEKSGTALQAAFARLDARSQAILSARWLDEDKLTLDELAQKYHISAERVRQLEKNAMLKLKKMIQEG